MEKGEVYAKVSEDRKSIESIFLVAETLIGVKLVSGLVDTRTGIWHDIPTDTNQYIKVSGELAISKEQKNEVLFRARPTLRDYIRTGRTPKVTSGGYRIAKMIDSGLEVSETTWPISAWIEVDKDTPLLIVGYDLQGEASIAHQDLDIVLED